MQKIINNALFLVSLLILFILFGFNEWNGDRDAYEDLFTGADSRPKCNTPRFNERGWSVGVS